MGQKDSDLDKIKQLIDIMKENDLVEIEIKHDDDKIFLKRSDPHAQPVAGIPIVAHNGPPAQSVTAMGQNNCALEAQSQQQQDTLEQIKAPIVGTLYATPSPDSEPYVEVGSHVEPKTVVCIIEAMKVMNEIKAETEGTIAQISVNNGQAVEYGQVLFKVKPD